MKDSKFILSKVAKKQAISILLVIMLMVLFFINIFSSQKVYACELVAAVKYDVNVVEGGNIQKLSSDNKFISNIDKSSVELGDVDVKLNSQSRIEINYVVENISNKSIPLNMVLEKLKMENFNVEYSLNEGNMECLTHLEHCLNVAETLNIKVVVSIADLGKNALLDGFLNLTFNT